MITLLFVVCLAADPTVCHVERSPAELQSAMGCMILSQQIMAAWANEHPKWHVEGEFKCHIGAPGKDT